MPSTTRNRLSSAAEDCLLLVHRLSEMLEAPEADRIRRVRSGTRKITLSEELASQILVEDIPA